ncbi:factor of DNA methylation 2-like [Oryza brachyantha]|uniref:factor of DNA methylation 2-like n=1 Tax=Oryza brachyantha TaxID=4533 RepID=UPI001ADAF698|nr:factor of DNA methylation 2-like [Oryza brachyantha]
MADADTDNAGGELIVWPWTGVPATATGDDDASAATTLTVHSQQHFAGVPTTALQEAAAHDGHGHRHHLAGARRRECRQLRRRDEGATAGAGEEGLPGDGAAGRFLPEASCAARSAEDGRVAANLAGVAEHHDGRARFLEAKCEEMAEAAAEAAAYRRWLHHELEELRKITECIMLEMNHDVHDENGRVASELDETGKEIDTKSQRIEELKGALEISSMMLPSGQCSVGDHAQMLQEIHKQDMEVIYAKLEQLEKQLEQRQALESTVRQLNMKIQAGERLRHDDYEHIYSIMICLRTIIDEEKERLVDSCADLIKRVQMNFSELRELRQELIKGFENMTISKNTIIGIKRMGELDDKPFHLACKRKHRDDDPWGKAAMLISYWQEELKKPSWHPFTTIQVDGEEKEVVDGDDPKLRQLCIDYGISVCNAVKAAMAELNEYNPRGRHVTNELWNFREGRKATTSEVVKYILKQLKTSSSQPDN